MSLTNLVAFCDGVMASVNNGGSADVVYLDFCKAFDTVPYNTLTTKLEAYGSGRWAPRWLRNWLDGCIQRVIGNGFTSKWKPVMSSQ